MSARSVIRKRVAGGDTALLALVRKAANDAASAGNYDEAAAMFQLEAEAVDEAPKVALDVGAAAEVNIGDGQSILGTVVAIHAAAKMVEVEHYEEYRTADGTTLPAGYVSTHPVDAVTVLLPPEPVAEPALPPTPALPPVDLSQVFDVLPKSAGSGVLVKSALAAQETHGGPVAFPDRDAPVTRNSVSDKRRAQEEKDVRAHA